jgi:hypothetical protein
MLSFAISIALIYEGVSIILKIFIAELIDLPISGPNYVA